MLNVVFPVPPLADKNDMTCIAPPLFSFATQRKVKFSILQVKRVWCIKKTASDKRWRGFKEKCRAKRIDTRFSFGGRIPTGCGTSPEVPYRSGVGFLPDPHSRSFP